MHKKTRQENFLAFVLALFSAFLYALLINNFGTPCMLCRFVFVSLYWLIKTSKLSCPYFWFSVLDYNCFFERFRSVPQHFPYFFWLSNEKSLTVSSFRKLKLIICFVLQHLIMVILFLCFLFMCLLYVNLVSFFTSIGIQNIAFLSVALRNSEQ